MANEVYTFFQFKDDWSDEFYWEENYAYVFKRKEDYDNFLKMMEIVKERYRGENEYSFGTNEACYYDSGWAFLNRVKITEITLDELNLFTKFGLVTECGNGIIQHVFDLFCAVATVEEIMKYDGQSREEAEEIVRDYHIDFDEEDED